MHTVSHYDVVIVGGGIAGLYAAYLLTRARPSLSFCVLEASAQVGGRISTTLFSGMRVVCGAGIGRKHKDVRLQRLLRDLDVPTRTFPIHHGYAPTTGVTATSMAADLRQLRAAARAAAPGDVEATSFRDFATQVLGKERYAAFVMGMGYTDFENADAWETLHHYGLEDNQDGWNGLSIPWKQLTEALVRTMGRNHIRTSTRVVHIDDFRTGALIDDGFCKVHLEHGDPLWARHVWVATPISTLRTLFPKHPAFRGYQAQPFLRLYARVAPASRAQMQQAVPTLTVVPAPLQTIIPMDPNKGIYMIAYADNAAARRLAKISSDTPAHRATLARMIARGLGWPSSTTPVVLEELQAHYWEEGTHFPRPMARDRRQEIQRQAMHPFPRVWAMGEAISEHPGWVEGTLESVDHAFRHFQKTYRALTTQK